MTAQTPIGSTKIPLALAFGTVGIGDAAGTLYTNVTSVVGYRMPQAGSVIGFANQMSGTLATGTLAFYPTLNGASMTNTFTNGTTNIGTFGMYERDQAQQGGFSFAAGDVVGLAFNKTGTVAPTTRDCNALLLVLLEGYDY
jgi:hypothetical protein